MNITSNVNLACWTVEPIERSLSKEPVQFISKFRPNAMSIREEYLVIKTVDIKKTHKFIKNTA